MGYVYQNFGDKISAEFFNDSCIPDDGLQSCWILLSNLLNKIPPEMTLAYELWSNRLHLGSIVLDVYLLKRAI